MPRPRIKGSCLWISGVSAAASTFAMVASWFGEARYENGTRIAGYWAEISRGEVCLDWLRKDYVFSTPTRMHYPEKWSIHIGSRDGGPNVWPPRFSWIPSCYYDSGPANAHLGFCGGSLNIHFPLWIISAPSLILFVRLWQTSRRGRNHCKCGYSRLGLAAGSRCPECGAEADDDAQHEFKPSLGRTARRVRQGIMFACGFVACASVAMMVGNCFGSFEVSRSGSSTYSGMAFQQGRLSLDLDPTIEPILQHEVEFGFHSTKELKDSGFEGFEWWPDCYFSSTRTTVYVPYWMIAIPSFLATLLLYHNLRRCTSGGSPGNGNSGLISDSISPARITPGSAEKSQEA